MYKALYLLLQPCQTLQFEVPGYLGADGIRYRRQVVQPIANGVGVQHRTTRHDHHIVGEEEFVEEFEGVSLVPAGIIVVLQVARRNKIMFYARELLRRRCRSTDRYAPENLTTVTIEDRAAVMLRYPQ